jgi:hypothetical protein
MFSTSSSISEIADLSHLNMISNVTEKKINLSNFGYSFKSSKSYEEISSNSNFLLDDRNSKLLEVELKIKANNKSEEAIAILKSEYFIEGEISKTEVYFEKLYSYNKLLFAETFQKTWLKLYKEGKPQLISNFICIISTFEYEWLDENADTLILAACAHYDPFVNEAALRAIESWGIAEHIEYLNSIRTFEIQWLEDYKQEIKEQLQGI